jgi:hypothetical protein
MSVYIIAQLKFTRRELYDRYQSCFMGVFSILIASRQRNGPRASLDLPS